MYPKTQVEDPQRPYRLWDAKEKKPVRYRYYSDHKRAHWAALKEMRWAKVDSTIEVYNAANGRLLGQYTRRISSIEFRGGDNNASK